VLGSRLSEGSRRGAGLALLAVGALRSIPVIMNVRAKTNGA
jgi:hypothetical protein